jgi:hypothetical protein
MGKLGLKPLGLKPLGFKLLAPRTLSMGMIAILGVFQAAAWTDALATPPPGRMNPDERHRLRQEVRQHSGPFPRPSVQSLPSNASPGPMVVPQSNPASAATAPQVPPGQAGGGRMVGPGGERLSVDDRRALRQQLREQRPQREGSAAQAGPVMSPSQPSSPPPNP